jgi:hypothetical protein
MCNYKSFRGGVGDVRFPKTAEELRKEVEKRGSFKRTPPVETQLTVIIVCPRCHKRMEVDYDIWVTSELPGTPAHKQYLCKNILCEGKKMIYHKMGNE